MVSILPVMFLATALTLTASTGYAQDCVPVPLDSATSRIASRVAVEDGIACVAAGDTFTNFDVFDVGDPTDLRLLSELELRSTLHDVAVRDGVAFVAPGEFLTIDISDPSNPMVLGEGPSSLAQTLDLHGDIALVASQFIGAQLIDIADPANPTLLGTVPTRDQTLGAAMVGDTVYVADFSAGVLIADASDPTDPQVRAVLDTDTFAARLFPSPDPSVLFLLEFSFSPRSTTLRALDITDPYAPVVLDSIDPGTFADMAFRGDIAFITGQEGLRQLDVSDPTDLRFVGPAVLADQDPAGLAFDPDRPGLLFATIGGQALQSIDISTCPPPCPADLDGDGMLTLGDFLAFQNLFDAGDPLADFDGDGDLTIFDFLAFQNAFDDGCD